MIDSYLQEENLASFFGRVNYKFMDRYILTASLRADGSSLHLPVVISGDISICSISVENE